MATFDSEDHTDSSLDKVGRRILALLQEDARLSFSEIGRQVGLTAPAVAERVNKMKEAGIITGFHAAIDPTRLGLGLTVYISVTAHPGWCDAVRDLALQQPTVIECYCTAGEKDVLIKGVFKSVQQLQALVNRLTPLGSVSTQLVLSTYLARRSLE
jgi:Lrp/AsnC family leucine-responsive transcriptional regulator